MRKDLKIIGAVFLASFVLLYVLPVATIGGWDAVIPVYVFLYLVVPGCLVAIFVAAMYHFFRPSATAQSKPTGTNKVKAAPESTLASRVLIDVLTVIMVIAGIVGTIILFGGRDYLPF